MVKRTTNTARTSVAVPAQPEMDTEFANRLSDPFETLYMGVLRTNDPLLLERGNGGAQIYADLERDGKVFDGLQKRKLALIGKTWQVEPVDDKAPGATADAETLTDILKACNFDKLCAELLDAILRGWAVSEIVWGVRGDDAMVVPMRLVQRATRRFVYVQEDPHAAPWLHLLTRENMVKGEPVPDRKFIVHRVNPKDDNPYGTGLGLQLFWPVFFKRKGIVAWNKLNDRFGAPTPHGKYPRNASPKEKGTLADALRAMSNDGYLITPEGMDVSLLESKLSGNVSTQESLCTYMDDWIGAVLTGQESRNGGGGALAAASKERQDVRQELTQADSDLLSETLNSTLLAWICEYNGLTPCHVWRQIKAEDDIKSMAETDKVVSDMGFELDINAVRSKYGEGWNKSTAQRPSPLGAPGGSLPNFAEPAPGARSRDALDTMVDDALDDWRPVLAPLVEPLQAAIDEAIARGDTAQQLLDRLPELLAQMNAEALHQSLTRAAFAARIGGVAGLPLGGNADPQ